VSTGSEYHEDDLARLVGGLAESALTLAALAAALQMDDPRVVLDDRHGRILGVLGLAAPAAGGWRLNPAVASVAASGGGAYAARLAATLRWAAAAAEGRVDWAEQDLGTNAALGRGSSLAGRVFVRVLAPRLGDLAQRLAAPGAVALDVGTGVGEIAVALAQAAPSLRVVGIDVLDDVLAAARTRVVEQGLADRIVLRRQDVVTLADRNVFDLAYPAYFVPEDAVVATLPRIRAALRPGGWIFVPAGKAPEPSWREQSRAGSTRDARCGVCRRPSAGWSRQGSATCTGSRSTRWPRRSWSARVPPGLAVADWSR
jgi:protein-L-isoaspartate O-methyltransferase